MDDALVKYFECIYMQAEHDWIQKVLSNFNKGFCLFDCLGGSFCLVGGGGLVDEGRVYQNTIKSGPSLARHLLSL